MCASPLRCLAGLICAGVSLAASELDREIVLAPQAGGAREDAEIRRWQERVAAKTTHAADYERLAWAFVAKARRTQDAGYYKLAQKTAELMDECFGASAEARLLRGHVLHNLHRFHEAEVIARHLVAERGQPGDFALWSDTLMELGDLSGAIAACQKLADLRPGGEAYGRIAHLRWLKGDLAGATAAMEMTLRATGPADAEGKAWALTRLAGFYLQAGRLDAAQNATQAALQHADDYAPAWLARGKSLLALGQGEAAIGALAKAVRLNPLPEYQWWFADALRGAGREAEAKGVEAELRQRGVAGDPRTLALFLATRGENPIEAVRLAREELTNRSDVQTHDALAWALAARGDLEAADSEMQRALAEGTRDARILLHAAEIARQRGRMADADKYLTAARAMAATLTPSERRRLAPSAAMAANTAPVSPAKL